MSEAEKDAEISSLKNQGFEKVSPRNNNGDLSRSWPKPLRDCGQCRILFDSTRIPKKKRQLS